MKSVHRVLFGDAATVVGGLGESVDLVVTSPPYPMIEMWDESFARQDGCVGDALGRNDGLGAFELMHRVLDKVWDAVYEVLRPGGFACINIGDATRTIDGHFRLYANHARILSHCCEIGFSNLPAIIWRKQTNAPNKFMGSGMLPAGAYVTLEHEFVLVLRKGNRRRFTTAAEKKARAESAIFWEERNVWFSDVWWDLKGAGQELNHSEARKRSGAYPFELAYRLINMFSVRGDTVLDPFLGTGTTTLAAITSGRNSVGIEIDSGLGEAIWESVGENVVERCNERIRRRFEDHLAFVEEREKTKGAGAVKYVNRPYGFGVMTRQEVELTINYLRECHRSQEGEIVAEYVEEAVVDPGDVEKQEAVGGRI